MTESSIITLMSQSLVVFMIWILPPLIASVVVGLVIG
ncbi:MAG: EscS/YscS/HrcS family type III secretion system export apparatus protein, partial [Mesorhizobium sp.]